VYFFETLLHTKLTNTSSCVWTSEAVNTHQMTLWVATQWGDRNEETHSKTYHQRKHRRILYRTRHDTNK